MDEVLKNQINFIIEVDKMKNIERHTRVIENLKRETDAEHSWHVALIANVLYDYAAQKDKIDIARVTKMLLVHDLVEVYAGDTFAFDEKGYEDKLEREQNAAVKIFGFLPENQREEYNNLWVEFDEEQTPDAQYAAAIDRLQPFINNSETNGYTWREGKVTLDQVYKRDALVKTAIPPVWEFVEQVIAEALRKGQIIKD